MSLECRVKNCPDGVWYEHVPDIPNSVYEELQDSIKHYIYYKSPGHRRRIGYCTHCGEYIEAWREDGEYIEAWREDTGVLAEMYNAAHNSTGNCPLCDYPITYKAVGRLQNGRSLNDHFYAAVICPVSFDEVWIRGVRFAVDFNFLGNVAGMINEPSEVAFHQDERLAVKPDIYIEEEHSRIRMVRGEGATIARRGWKGWKTLRTRRAEPFISSIFASVPDYHMLNVADMDNTFLKYSCFDRFCNILPPSSYYGHRTLLKPVRFLCEYARTPSLEMMLKFDGTEFVSDLIYENNKNSRLINWKARSPDKFFRLSKPEARTYIASGCDKDTLLLYHEARAEKFTIMECIEYLRDFYLHNYEEISKYAKAQNMPVRDILKYLRKQRLDNDIWHIYHDYISFAGELGYDLTVHNVRYPKDLNKAHDQASKAAIKLKKQIELEKYARELKDRELRYNFAMGNYTIFIPEDPTDIIDEGKALKHCVGGYVDRHCEGKCTILFMRHIPDWNVPLYTIEMRGGNMQQVQGYNNRIENKPVGEAENVLNVFLDWVKAGSPRKEDGRPELNAKCRMQNAELRKVPV